MEAESTERAQLAEVLRMIRSVQRQLQLARWRPTLISRRYGKRSAEKILESKEVNYVATCLDLTFALTHQLKKRGFNPTFVVDELVGEHTNKPTLHFAVELEINGKPHTIDFAANKSALFYDGHFNHGRAFPGLLQLGEHKFGTQELKSNQTPMEFLEIRRLREINKRFPKVKYKDLRAVLAQLKKVDSERLFGIIRARRPRIVATMHRPINRRRRH